MFGLLFERAAMISQLRSLSVFVALSAAAWSQDGPAAWPQFRGPQASGVADGHALPVHWVGDPAPNAVAWSVEVPGVAHASPIVWGDSVFVATAIPEGIDAEVKLGLYGAGDSAEDMVDHEFRLLCFDLETGEQKWNSLASSMTPKVKRHTKATHVNCTPATDGERVVALFGSAGLHCFDMSGKRLWKVDLGSLDVGPHDSMELQWGFASSPILVDGHVVVQADVKEEPFLAAFDLESGDEVWRVTRDDLTSWATPTACTVDGETQILVNGCKHMGAYRLTDGSEVWRMAGGGGLPVPAPVVVDDLVYLTSNHRPIERGHLIKPLFAVRLSAAGQLPVLKTDTDHEHVAWVRDRVGNYIQTPLVYRGLVFMCSASGVLNVLDAKTGESKTRRRLGEGGVGFSASGVAGDGKVYFTSEAGDVHVIAATAEAETLHVNSLGDTCMATPAVAGGTLVFRTGRRLLAIR